jgi:hypothetical protein
MAVTINASTSAGLVQTADTSGVLALQSNGTTALTTSGANVTVVGTLTTAAQSIAKASLPTGSVLQVVTARYNTAASNSTTTYADTGLTASITPSSATSKILVVVHQADPYKSVGDIGSGVNIRLVRDSTTIETFGLANCYTGTSLQNNGTTISTSVLDSPATTSSTTYKTQFANFVAASIVGIQATGGTSTITLMEIAA